MSDGDIIGAAADARPAVAVDTSMPPNVQSGVWAELPCAASAGATRRPGQYVPRTSQPPLRARGMLACAAKGQIRTDRVQMISAR